MSEQGRLPAAGDDLRIFRPRRPGVGVLPRPRPPRDRVLSRREIRRHQREDPVGADVAAETAAPLLMAACSELLTGTLRCASYGLRLPSGSWASGSNIPLGGSVQGSRSAGRLSSVAPMNGADDLGGRLRRGRSAERHERPASRGTVLRDSPSGGPRRRRGPGTAVRRSGPSRLTGAARQRRSVWLGFSSKRTWYALAKRPRLPKPHSRATAATVVEQGSPATRSEWARSSRTSRR